MHRKWTTAGHRVRQLLLALVQSGTAHATAPCPAPAILLQPLAPGVWLVPGAEADTTPANRGALSNLLAVREGGRLWLVGSGPSGAYARALDCRLRRVAGQSVTDVVAPWPRPELVLGQAGLPRARRWAHAAVADAMRERCPRCIARLRQRLGSAADDLGDAATALPDHLLHGDRGRLGPFAWQRLPRAAGTSVTLWSLPRLRLTTAHGLLWADGAPDLRDADSAVLARSWQQLAHAADASPGVRWIPEQGPVQPASAPRAHLQYLARLQAAVEAAQERGTPESDPAPTLPDVSAQSGTGARHALNWQHAWREAEAHWVAPTHP